MEDELQDDGDGPDTRGRAALRASRRIVAMFGSLSCNKGRAAVQTAKARPGREGTGTAPL